MKSFNFILLLVTLVGGGFYLTATKLNILDNSIEFVGGEIVPKSEWSKILGGKWKYKRTYKASFFIWIHEGEVEYYPDGRFTRYVTCKYYEGWNGRVITDNLHAVAGGSCSGKWVIDSSNQCFIEKIEACNFSIGRQDNGYDKLNLDFCSHHFNSGNTWLFGDVSLPKSKFDLKRFDEEKIVIKGTEFNNGASIDIVFTKNE